MKTPSAPQSATSLPQAPTDESGARFRKYLITMAVRLVCIVAMVLITPYGWYTWLLAIGAVFLPYVAVVIANVGSDVRSTVAESPERMLEAAPSAPPAPPAAPSVLRISESPALPRPPETPPR